MASTSEVWTREFAQGALRADRYVPLPQTAIVPRAPSSDGKRVQIATFVSKAAVERLDLDTVRRRSKSRGVKGDLVLIADELLHRGQWPLSVVIEPISGNDGLGRSAKI